MSLENDNKVQNKRGQKVNDTIDSMEESARQIKAWAVSLQEKEQKKVRSQRESETPVASRDVVNSEDVVFERANNDTSAFQISEENPSFVVDGKITDNKVKKKEASERENKYQEATNRAKNTHMADTKRDAIKNAREVKRKKDIDDGNSYFDPKVSNSSGDSSDSFANMLGLRENQEFDEEEDYLSNMKGVGRKDNAKSDSQESGVHSQVRKSEKKEKQAVTDKYASSDGGKIFDSSEGVSEGAKAGAQAAKDTAKTTKETVKNTAGAVADATGVGAAINVALDATFGAVRTVRREAVEFAFGEGEYNPFERAWAFGKNLAKKSFRKVWNIVKIWLALIIVNMFQLLLSILILFLPAIILIISFGMLLTVMNQTAFSFFAPLSTISDTLTTNENFFIKYIDDRVFEINNEVETWQTKTYSVGPMRSKYYEVIRATEDENYYYDIVALYLAEISDQDFIDANVKDITSGNIDTPWLIVDTEEERSLLNEIISSLYYIDVSQADTSHKVFVYRNGRDAYLNKYQKEDDTMLAIISELCKQKIEAGELVSKAAAEIRPYDDTVLIDYKYTEEEQNKIVETARKCLGSPYVWGAQGPNQFDCSGLVYWVMKEAGISNGTRTTAAYYYSRCIAIEESELEPGDLVFFEKKGATHHIGIVVNPKKHTMIHAPQQNDVVKESSYKWKNERVYFGRLVE